MMTSIFITINLVVSNMWKAHTHKTTKQSLLQKANFPSHEQVNARGDRHGKMETKATVN